MASLVNPMIESEGSRKEKNDGGDATVTFASNSPAIPRRQPPMGVPTTRPRNDAAPPAPQPQSPPQQSPSHVSKSSFSAPADASGSFVNLSNSLPEPPPAVDDEKKGASAIECSDTTKRAAASLRLSDEVHIASIHQYLAFSVQKITTLKGAGLHVVCLVLLTLSAVMVRLDSDAPQLHDFMAHELFPLDDADAVTTFDGGVQVAATIISNVFEAERWRTSGTCVALEQTAFFGVLSVRLYRVERRECSDDASRYLPDGESTLQSIANDSCVTEQLTSSSGDGEGESDNSSSDGDDGIRLYRGVALSGFLRSSYDALPRASVGYNVLQFIPPFDERNSSAAVDALHSMVAATSGDVIALIIESAIFDGASGGIMHAAYLLEKQFDSTRATVVLYPFIVRSLKEMSTYDILTLILDILLFIVAVVLIVEGIRTLLLNIHLLRHSEFGWISAFEFWECFNLFFAGAFVVFLVLKGVAWTNSTDIVSMPESTSNAEMFEKVMSLKNLMRTLYTSVSWLLMLAYLRSFRFLRFSLRLSTISQTIGSSLNEMIGVFVIFLVVTCSFGYGGVLLFGTELPDSMGTFSQAVQYLVLMLLNGELDEGDMDLFYAVDDISTKVYFTIYMLLAWGVLLNVLVGVLALSFGSVTETLLMMPRPDWRPAAIARDFVKLMRRLNAASSDVKFSVFVADRIHMLSSLQLWQAQGFENYQSGPDYVSLKRLLKYSKHGFTEGFVRLVFLKAQQQVGTDDARVRNLRLQHRAINNTHSLIERLKSQQSMVDDIHTKVCITKSLDASHTAMKVMAASPVFSMALSEAKHLHNQSSSVEEIMTVESARISAIAAKSGRLAMLVSAATGMNVPVAGAAAARKRQSTSALSLRQSKQEQLEPSPTAFTGSDLGSPQMAQSTSIAHQQALAAVKQTGVQLAAMHELSPAERAELRRRIRALNLQEAETRKIIENNFTEQLTMFHNFCQSRIGMLPEESVEWRKLLAASAKDVILQHAKAEEAAREKSIRAFEEKRMTRLSSVRMERAAESNKRKTMTDNDEVTPPPPLRATPLRIEPNGMGGIDQSASSPHRFGELRHTPDASVPSQQGTTSPRDFHRPFEVKLSKHGFPVPQSKKESGQYINTPERRPLSMGGRKPSIYAPGSSGGRCPSPPPQREPSFRSPR